jgi:hypothetical protein
MALAMQKKHLLTCLVLGILCSGLFAQQPPAPERATDTLFMPTKVTEARINGAVSLPAQSRLAFALNMDGSDPGKYRIEGTVLVLKDRFMDIQVKEGKEATFEFCLPPGMALYVQQGDPVTIEHEPVFSGNSKGYDLRLSGGNTLRLKSGKLFGEKPIRVALGPGLELLQEAPADPGDFFREAPVYLRLYNQRIRIPLQQLTKFPLTDGTGELFIQISHLREERADSLNERSGYTLHYVWIRK